MPDNIRTKLEAYTNPEEIPVIEAYQVWNMMKSGSKTKSSVPGELPARLRHEFGPKLAEPAALIFNKIVTSGQWPQHWKEGSPVPLKKVTQPADEGDVRLIEILAIGASLWRSSYYSGSTVSLLHSLTETSSEEQKDIQLPIT